MAVPEYTKRAIEKYNKRMLKSYTIHLNRKTDEDIISFLDGLENKQGYIKNLIREDMRG